MREISFRGKTPGGHWVTGGFVELVDFYDSSKRRFVIVDSDLEDHEENDVDPDTVGQFTGLYDKNGKMIYEGDIVSETVVGQVLWDGDAIVIETAIGEIYWNKYGWGASQTKHGKARMLSDKILGNKGESVEFSLTKYDGEFIGWNSIEVIGNIHELEGEA